MSLTRRTRRSPGRWIGSALVRCWVRGWAPSLGWWPCWLAMSWPTSPFSPARSTRWKNASPHRVRAQARSLLTIVGCAELTAAKVVGETAGVSRFRSEAAFACYAGVAPLPRSSGGSRVRVRAVRSGNRQLNVALYRIAFTQIRHPGTGQVYYQKRRAAGDTHAEALRRLQRRVVRHVFGCLRADCADRPATSQTPR
jgi:hypothetical protein